MQYDENAEKYGYEGEMTPLKCDELKAYKADVTVPVYGTIADAEVYLKEKADAAIAELKEAIATLRGANEEKTERIIELQKQVDELDKKLDEYVLVKLSTQQMLQNLLDCGLIKEWYFNGKFNAILKADDPHLQIKELKKENERLKNGKMYTKLQHDTIIDAMSRSHHKELRATKRALWLARAYRAEARKNYWYARSCHEGDERLWSIDGSAVKYIGCIKRTNFAWLKVWSEVESKCLKKADFYL